MLKKMADILDVFEELIRHRIIRGDTHTQVSGYFRSLFSSCRGLSARNVRRFCSAQGIHYRSNLSEIGLDELIRRCVFSVGHTYGRRSLHGLLRAHGIHVTQERLGRALSRTFPMAFSHRSRNLRSNLNPVPYCARFFATWIRTRS